VKIFVVKWEWQLLLIRFVKPGYDSHVIVWSCAMREEKQQCKTNKESIFLRKTKLRKTKEEMDGRGATRFQAAHTQR